MTECEKCIRAQDERDPFGASSRALRRALTERLQAVQPLWPPLPEDPLAPAMICMDCPACGKHVFAHEGDEWCFMCSWQLKQVENHSGPPVETGFKVGDIVRAYASPGRVNYIDPSGFIEILSGGWTIRIDHEDVHEVVLVERP